MLTKIKAICKEPMFWELITISLLLLLTVIALAVVLQTPSPQAPTQTTATTVPTTPPVLGIDVSEHQEVIDWQQVKASGMEFVMIRVGWRGYTQGELFADTLAQTHYAGAKAAGIKVGAYIFSQATSAEEGIEEANYLLEQTKDWEIDMYLALNWEHVGEENRTASVDARTLTDITKAFCQTLTKANKRPMVYFDAYLASTRLFIDELTEYPFWLAQYAEEMAFTHPVKMWQYTCTGTVPGIDENLDINRYYTE
ncbi:MAG: glycoside hydrolase family 25 protein [Oscillospiraceae bacterium]|nr:glycoside hydrolase family 25 protein [Oscillospiraceae bacterium]